jgi:hypothetical protein
MTDPPHDSGTLMIPEIDMIVLRLGLERIILLKVVMTIPLLDQRITIYRAVARTREMMSPRAVAWKGHLLGVTLETNILPIARRVVAMTRMIAGNQVTLPLLRGWEFVNIMLKMAIAEMVLIVDINISVLKKTLNH